MDYIPASGYMGLENRGRNPEVETELLRIVSALPTQIKPEDRTALLRAILGDLSCKGIWRRWAQELYTLAITAVKVLGRNPIGSEVILEQACLSTLVYHTGLPFEPSTLTPAAPPALEAQRALANTLVLHAPARKLLAMMGGGPATARALAEPLPTDRLFLVCRIGFLVTADGFGVKDMVEGGDIVNRIIHHLGANKPVPINYDALSELLKLTGNIVRIYPSKIGEDWSDRLNPLLSPILSFVHDLALSDLLPPLTHGLHALLSFPVNSDTLPMWTSSSSGGPRKWPGLRLLPKRSRSPLRADDTSSTSSFSGASGSSSSSSSEGAPRKRAEDAFPLRLMGILTEFVRSHLPGRAEPNPELQLEELLPPILLLGASTAQGSVTMRACYRHTLIPPNLDRSKEAGGLETRPGVLGTILRLLNSTEYANCSNAAGEFLWEVCGGDASELCDEVGYGNVAGLMFKKGMFRPPPAKIKEIDSPRPSVSSQKSLRHRRGESRGKSMSRRPSFSSSRRGSESVPASRRGSENAPPSAFDDRFANLPPSPAPTSPSASNHSHGGASGPFDDRHGINPITGLRHSADDFRSPFEGMSNEEKEREAEKMFVLFDRLKSNPVVKAGVPQPDGSEKDIQREIRDKMVGQEGETWERLESEKEKERIQRQDDQDEQEALAELAAYRKRMGRS